MGMKIQLFEVWSPQTLPLHIFLSVGMDEKRSLQRKSKHKETNWSLALWIVLPSYSKNVKTTSGELHVLSPRGLKIALILMVEFLNTYFELFQFIEIIYITNKYNQYVTCLSFCPFVRLSMRNIQTAVYPHQLKTGHMFIWTYLLGIIHTTIS
jgi:hypothetical protein